MYAHVVKMAAVHMISLPESPRHSHTIHHHCDRARFLLYIAKYQINQKSRPTLLSIPERLLPSCLHEGTSYNWHYYMQGTWKLTLAQGRLTYFYVGIVCKSFYLDVIQNELGISDDGNIIDNTVYKPIYQKVNDIYTFHEEKLSSTFGVKLLDINHYIPLLYLTSKQHKCPYKFRFIAGASKCYNKQLSIELSLALKCIKNHFKNYCKVIQKEDGHFLLLEYRKLTRI